MSCCSSVVDDVVVDCQKSCHLQRVASGVTASGVPGYCYCCYCCFQDWNSCHSTAGHSNDGRNWTAGLTSPSQLSGYCWWSPGHFHLQMRLCVYFVVCMNFDCVSCSRDGREERKLWLYFLFSSSIQCLKIKTQAKDRR